MTFILLPNNKINQASEVPKLSIKQAGYSEAEVRDLVANKIETFFPGLKTIATEFSRWDDSARRLDILAIDKDRNLHVMEFKRDNEAAHAELQAIRYAAMLSVCNFNDLVQAGYHYRKKSNTSIKIDDWESELLNFLCEKDAKEVELPRIPRIVLLSSQFSKEITTTVLWLNERFGSVDEGVLGMDIVCIEISVYDLIDQRALHFDQIIPISEAQEYQIRARAKELDSEKKQAKEKRARTVLLLESNEILKPNSQIVVIEGSFKSLNITNPIDKEARFIGEGRFIWAGNDQPYDSLNALTRALHERYGQPMSNLQAPQYWRLSSSELSLAEMTDQIISSAK